jgi:hypothetical protein
VRVARAELLADERGADGLARRCIGDDRAVGLVGEGDLRDAGDGERIDHAGDEREEEEEDERGAEVGEHEHGGSFQIRAGG